MLAGELLELFHPVGDPAAYRIETLEFYSVREAVPDKGGDFPESGHGFRSLGIERHRPREINFSKVSGAFHDNRLSGGLSYKSVDFRMAVLAVDDDLGSRILLNVERVLDTLLETRKDGWQGVRRGLAAEP